MESDRASAPVPLAAVVSLPDWCEWCVQARSVMTRHVCCGAVRLASGDKHGLGVQQEGPIVQGRRVKAEYSVLRFMSAGVSRKLGDNSYPAFRI
jgi:hypothetical protein